MILNKSNNNQYIERQRIKIKKNILKLKESEAAKVPMHFVQF